MVQHNCDRVEVLKCTDIVPKPVRFLAGHHNAPHLTGCPSSHHCASADFLTLLNSFLLLQYMTVSIAVSRLLSSGVHSTTFQGTVV